jgi:aspartate racemase
MNSRNTSLPRIGILGGMGPMASAEFVVELVKATPARFDQEHFPTTLDSSPQIPDRPNAIYHDGPDPLPAIAEAIRRLENSGCAMIAMPCNTVHHWYDRMLPLTQLPILHIADAVAARLREVAPQAKRVGVLGSRVTSQQGIYSNRLGDEWAWAYASDHALRTLVMPAIVAVKAGDLIKGRVLFMEAVRAMLALGVDAIVYACTEIPVVLTPADVPLPVIDSSEALARHTVAVAQAIYRERCMATEARVS